MAPRKLAAGAKLMCSRQSLCVVNDQRVMVVPVEVIKRAAMPVKASAYF
jgi:hypothetical protein